MAGSFSFFLVLLALSSVAFSAPNADPTAASPTGSPPPSGDPANTQPRSLPGLVAHQDSRQDGQGAPAGSQGPQPTDSTGDSPPPPYAPVVTPPPDLDARLASQGYSQETYYTCNTIAGSAYCGWHVPLVKAPTAGGSAAVLQSVGGAAAGTGAVVAAVACLAGVFALGMV